VIFLAMEILLFSKGARHISLPSEGVANCTQVGKPVNRNRQAEASCAQPAITRTQKNRSRGAVRLLKSGLPSPIAEFAATLEQ